MLENLKSYERMTKLSTFLSDLYPVRENILNKRQVPKEELQVLRKSAQACELDKKFVFNLLLGRPTEWHELLSKMLQLGIDVNLFSTIQTISPFRGDLILCPDYEKNTLSTMGKSLRQFVAKVATKQRTKEKRYLLMLFVLRGDAFQQKEKDREMAAQSFFQMAIATQEIEGLNAKGIEMPKNMADMFSDSFMRKLKGEDD